MPCTAASRSFLPMASVASSQGSQVAMSNTRQAQAISRHDMLARLQTSNIAPSSMVDTSNGDVAVQQRSQRSGDRPLGPLSFLRPVATSTRALRSSAWATHTPSSAQTWRSRAPSHGDLALHESAVACAPGTCAARVRRPRYRRARSRSASARRLRQAPQLLQLISRSFRPPSADATTARNFQE
jgi:hypothetical protein